MWGEFFWFPCQLDPSWICSICQWNTLAENPKGRIEKVKIFPLLSLPQTASLAGALFPPWLQLWSAMVRFCKVILDPLFLR